MDTIKLILPSFFSLLSAFIFFYILPRRTKRIEASFQLIDLYHSDGMEAARRTAWAFFTEPKTQKDNIDSFCHWIKESDSHGGDNIEMFQKLLRVFNFFAMVDMCLERDQVDGELVRAGLGWSYNSWRKVLAKVTQQLGDAASGSHQPAFRRKLTRLNGLVDGKCQRE
jgi:hypothetical protein